MEIVSKLIDFLKELMPTVIGWFLAKKDSEVNNLKDENEELKKYNEIDNKPIDGNVYDSRMWK